MNDSQGGRAVANGGRAVSIVTEYLRLNNYTYLKAPTLSQLLAARKGLFAEPGCFATECCVPLLASYHANQKFEARADVAVISARNDTVLISVKSQHSDGSADEKLEYEIQQLIATELPAALVVLGPISGRNGAMGGWREHVLQQVWQRTRYYGSGRIYLFRTAEKLVPWIRDGMPVSGRGQTWSAIFNEYCDKEP